jgi:hypothetical protein
MYNCYSSYIYCKCCKRGGGQIFTRKREVKVEVLGGVKFLGPVVYNQEGMQWHGHILYITPGGDGEIHSFLKLSKNNFKYFLKN